MSTFCAKPAQKVCSILLYIVREVLRNINNLATLPPFGNRPKKFDFVHHADCFLLGWHDCVGWAQDYNETTLIPRSCNPTVSSFPGQETSNPQSWIAVQWLLGYMLMSYILDFISFPDSVRYTHVTGNETSQLYFTIWYTYNHTSINYFKCMYKKMIQSER